MPDVLFCASANEIWSVGAGPFYFPPGSPRLYTITTEANAKAPVRAAGTWHGLTGRLSGNTITVASTIKSRVDTGGGSVDGNQIISFPSSTSGSIADSTNVDVLADGYFINLKVTLGGTGANCTPVSMTSAFKADSGVHTVFCSNSSTASFPFSATNYWCISGDLAVSGDSTEANVQSRLHNSCVVSHLFAYVSANTSSGSATIRNRIGGSNGSLVLSVGAGVTGFFEDTTHSDFVAADSLCNYSIQATGLSYTLALLGMWALLGDAPCDVLAQRIADCTYSGTTGYMAVGGYMGTPPAGAEVSAQARVPFTSAWSRLRARLRTNSMTGTITVDGRKNTANGSQSVSVATTLTGAFEDTTNIDSLVNTDDIAIRISGGTSGTATFREFSNQIKDIINVTGARRVQVLAK